jgi:hypothetical protein
MICLKDDLIIKMTNKTTVMGRGAIEAEETGVSWSYMQLGSYCLLAAARSPAGAL